MTPSTSLHAERSVRIAPLSPPWSAELGALLTRMTPPGAPNVLNLFQVLAVNPALAERMRSVGAYLLGAHASLNLHQRELAIQRVCYRCGAEYEWGVHVTAFAQQAALDAGAVDAIASGPASGLADADAALVEFIDSLIDRAQVSDQVFARISAQLNPAAIIELIILVGWYQGISYVCNVAGVPLETWQARFAQSPTRAG
jgi:alkylhydroperoxidase family enzyme